jgi:SHS2 domain-containing protein
MHRDFEVLPHTADIKIRVYGDTLEQLFAHALIGMFQAVGPHAARCTKVGERLICDMLPEKHEIEIHSVDLESLLVDFLSQALYFSDIYNEAYLKADVHQITQTYIKATLHGIKITGFDVVEIKAVTYHELYIKRIDDYWQAQLVFDI